MKVDRDETRGDGREGWVTEKKNAPIVGVN